jgi:hypothetical protein
MKCPVGQQVDSLDAVAADGGLEEIVPDVPAVLGEVLVAEPPARLEDTDPVALLAQAKCGDAPAEAGSDHEHVVVERSLSHAPTSVAAERGNTCS